MRLTAYFSSRSDIALLSCTGMLIFCQSDGTFPPNPLFGSSQCLSVLSTILESRYHGREVLLISTSYRSTVLLSARSSPNNKPDRGNSLGSHYPCGCIHRIGKYNAFIAAYNHKLTSSQTLLRNYFVAKRGGQRVMWFLNPFELAKNREI